jgi:hypothetical protein
VIKQAVVQIWTKVVVTTMEILYHLHCGNNLLNVLTISPNWPLSAPNLYIIIRPYALWGDINVTSWQVVPRATCSGRTHREPTSIGEECWLIWTGARIQIGQCSSTCCRLGSAPFHVQYTTFHWLASRYCICRLTSLPLLSASQLSRGRWAFAYGLVTSLFFTCTFPIVSWWYH